MMVNKIATVSADVVGTDDAVVAVDIVVGDAAVVAGFGCYNVEYWGQNEFYNWSS